MDLQQIVALFVELAGIDGESGSERPVAQYIIDYLQRLNLPVYEDRSAAITGSSTGNVICEVNGGGDFVLVAHMDTAFPTKGAKPVVLNDRIASDGTTILGADDRLGIAAILYAIRYALEQNIPIRPFTMAFTTCEEATMLGSENLQLSESISSGFVFDSYLPAGSFINQSIGVVAIVVEINGGNNVPVTGVNATQIAVEAMSGYPFGRISCGVMADIGLAESSVKHVTSDFIVMRGEVRALSSSAIEEQVEKIKQVFINAARKYGGTATLNSKWKLKPYYLSSQDQPYKKIADIFKLLKLEPKENASWNGSDANHLNGKGIQTINLGIGIQNPHSTKEYVLFTDISSSARIALELIRA